MSAPTSMQPTPPGVDGPAEDSWDRLRAGLPGRDDPGSASREDGAGRARQGADPGGVRHGLAPYWTPVRAAWFVVVLGVVLRAWVTLSGTWYWDDYAYLGRAARLPLDLEYLFHTYDGHLMPGVFLLQWWLTRTAGMSFLIPAVLLIAGQAMAFLLFLRLAVLVIGRRWATTLAVTVVAWGSLTLPASVWWAAALNSIPLQIGLLVALGATVRWTRTGAARHGWLVVLATAVTLLFFVKALLIPVACFALPAVLRCNEPVHLVLRDVLRRGWRQWTAVLGVVVGYLGVFLWLGDRTPGQGLEIAAWIQLVGRGVAATLGPALLGGPWLWQPVGFGTAIGRPPFLLVVLAVEALVALVLVSSWRSTRALRGWLWAGGYVVLALTGVSLGRLSGEVDPTVVQGTRYLADAAVPVALAVGLAIVAVAPVVDRVLSAVPILGRRPPVTRRAATAWLALGVLLASSTVSVVQYRTIWRENASRGYIESARTAVRDADPGTVLLDQPVPTQVLYGLAFPHNQASWVMAPFSPAPAFDRQTRDLQAFDGSGDLVPAYVVGVGNEPGPEAGCGYRVEGRRTAVVNLQADIVPYEHTVRIGYTATAPTRVRVALAEGEAMEVWLDQGVNAVFLRLAGGGTSLRITGLKPAVSLCTNEVTVGTVEPLPAGGS